MTLVSKKRSQSASEISSNGLGSKIPKLLTKMSTSGTCLTSPAAPSAVDRSAATPSTSAVPVPAVLRSRSTAALTRSALRPLTMIDAPSRTSPAAAAKPIPAVEPVISARFPRSCRSIGYSSRTNLDLGQNIYLYISLTPSCSVRAWSTGTAASFNRRSRPHRTRKPVRVGAGCRQLFSFPFPSVSSSAAQASNRRGVLIFLRNGEVPSRDPSAGKSFPAGGVAGSAVGTQPAPRTSNGVRTPALVS